MTALSFVQAVAAVLLLFSAIAAELHQSTTVAAEPTPNRGWSLANVAFMPRGGGAISFRKGKSSTTQAPANKDLEINEEEEQSSEEDAIEEISFDEADNSSDETITTTVSPFQKAYQEEVSEIKKSQQFLQMQQRRRELDKTWLDKGITAVIELFENIFRWEVID
mmetsp:Transcript_1258/g.2109  ORF Transcript_1258/g.2109 Transcript_1258/m.2109 type:complete len:165 (-) Transcript_1258:702-1196(-)